MIVDYTSLQSAIADWLARADLATQIQTFINQAESRIYRDLRVIDMEKALSGALTASSMFAVPADYLSMKDLYISTSAGFQAVERADLWWMRNNYPTQSAQGTPGYYAREGQNFVFAPYADSTYSVGGIYFARLPALSGTNTTNWLITKNPDLIFAAAMLEAATYLMSEDAIEYWEQRYQSIAAQVQQADRSERYSGSPIAVKRG